MRAAAAAAPAALATAGFPAAVRCSVDERSPEPRSVLDRHRSSSPTHSSSTFSSSLGPAGGAGESELAAALHGWEPVVAEAAPPPPEQTFLRWISGESAADGGPKAAFLPPAQELLLPGVSDLGVPDNAEFAFGYAESVAFPFDGIGAAAIDQPPLFPPDNLPPLPQMVFDDSVDCKPPPLLFNTPTPPLPRATPAPAPVLNIHPAYTPLPSSKRRLSSDAATAGQPQQQQALLDELFEAARLVQAGLTAGAREILARLNHLLPFAPVGKNPLLRSAFYLKNALLAADHHAPPPPPPLLPASPLDVALKLAAFKSFSDVSPIPHFSSFTVTQALLDELGAAASARVHVFDFDICSGGQWASFMQELAHRCATLPSTAPPSLKVTAFVSAAVHQPLELHLVHENLSHFATDLGVHFEFNIFCLDAFDHADLLAILGVDNDATVAVTLPVAAWTPLPAILPLVKQLNPRIVVAINHRVSGGEDLPFAEHATAIFQSCAALLDSLDATGVDPSAAGKIERFLLQPQVDAAILARCGSGPPLPWRAVLAAAGFAPVPLSGVAEAQAEYLLRRAQVRGFRAERCPGGALALYWQRAELVAVSTWRC